MSLGINEFLAVNTPPVDILGEFQKGRQFASQIGLQDDFRNIAANPDLHGSELTNQLGRAALQRSNPQLGTRLLEMAQVQQQRQAQAQASQSQNQINELKTGFDLISKYGDDNSAMKFLTDMKSKTDPNSSIGQILGAIDRVDLGNNTVSYDRVVTDRDLEAFPFLMEAGAKAGEKASFSVDLNTGARVGQVNIAESKKDDKFVQSLRKEAQADPIIKSASEINQAVSRMASVYRDFISKMDDVESKNALDQALVITFNKMLDPGSVVRESEFARTGQGQALLAKAEGYADKLSKGGVGLNNEGRRDIVRTAYLLQQGQKGLVDQKLLFYQNEAKNSGIDPSRITGGISRLDEGVFEELLSEPTPQPKPQTESDNTQSDNTQKNKVLLKKIQELRDRKKEL